MTTDCILVPCEQGSEEWFGARAGVLTAGDFHLMRRKPGARTPTGWTEKALDLAFCKAIERECGKPLQGREFQTAYTLRGHALEPAARLETEMRAGIYIERAGIARTFDGKFGCSADGYVGDDEGFEAKCFLAPEKLRTFWTKGDLSSVMDQIQGGMWITGRKRWHFALYCPPLAPSGRHLFYRVVERDDDYIEALELDLLRFDRLVEDVRADLRALPGDAPKAIPMEPVDYAPHYEVE